MNREYTWCYHPLGVTVLSNLITFKFVHQKFIQKYEWIEHVSIYHHTKFEVEQNMCKKKQKRETLLMCLTNPEPRGAHAMVCQINVSNKTRVPPVAKITSSTPSPMTKSFSPPHKSKSPAPTKWYMIVSVHGGMGMQ